MKQVGVLVGSLFAVVVLVGAMLPVGIASASTTVSITVNASSPTPPPGQTATFGLDSGDNTWGERANVIDGMKFECPDDGTLSKIGLLVDDASPSGNVKVAIYDHDVANDLPENLLWGGSSTPVTDGWMEWETSPIQLSANTTYWLVFWLDMHNGVRYQSGAGRHVWWYWPYGDWSEALDDTPASRNNNQYVMQATYITGGGSGNVPPTAEADGPYAGEEGSAITFDGSGSYDPDGTIVSYSWDFGDGSTGNSVTTTHAYADNGGYIVALTVTDDMGMTDTDTATVTVNNVTPTADAGGPYSGDEGEEITLTGSATDPGADTFTYTWDFGDESAATGQTVTHAYTQEGECTVTLTVEDDDGGVGTDITTANILDADPVTSFSYSPATPAAGSPVQFTDESSSYDGITSWSWDFDASDGIQVDSTEQNPAHTYDSAGDYMVSLTVSESDGDTDTTTQTVTVSEANQPPVGDAGPDKTAYEGSEVAFDGSGSYDPDGSIVSYEWDFGDEATATGITTTHTYSTAGTYTVTLTVTDNEGATDTDTCIITVSSPGDNNTAIGALELKSTFHCISVYSNFAGDDNGDNQGALEYREVGGSWLPGIEMTVDRRDTVISGGSPTSNPYKNQWRASIFGLQPNTEYEVRVTYADPDGVTGSPVTATIRTRNDNPPSAGDRYYVATTGSDSTNPGTEALPFRTIQKAADTVQAGDKVLIKAGTYNEKVTILASGTADNYITFMPYGDGDVVIDGQGIQEYGIAVGVSGIVGTGSGTRQGGDYVRVSGLKVVNSLYAGMNVGGDNVIIENCEIRDFNVADHQNADHRTSGITVNNWGTSNLVIRGNLITRNIGASGFNAPMGIHIYNAHSDQGGGHIIYNNRIIANNGNIKDGIGGLWNFSYPGSLYRDSDIYDNYIANCYDDGIESEGGNMNVRIWKNTIEDCQTMGLAFASTVLGPLYVFQNVMTGFEDAAFKLGHDSYGVAYIYHNTAYTTSGSGNGITHYGGWGLDNMVFRNNIIQVGRYVIECENNSYDYDNLYTTDPNRFAKLYIDGTWHYCGSLSALQSATGQELNGISADSQFVDPANDDLSLQVTSPCIDRGVVLPGFNDANSPWPYSGSAPDIGAFEFVSGTPPGPLHHINVTPSSVSLEIDQVQQFSAAGYDQNDNVITGLSFTWSVIDPAAGSIDGNGLFTAGTVTGTYPNVIKAEADSVAGYASVGITVNPPNSAPVAVDDAYSVGENTTLTTAAPGVLANDSDVDGDPLTAVLVSSVSNGTLTLNADGSFSYTPAPDYNGSDSFSYVANDGTVNSNTAAVSITVNPTPPPGQTATFGLDSGDNTWGEGANVIDGMKFECPDDGTLSKIGLLVDDASPSGNVKVAIYDHDAANDLPENLLWGGSSTPITDGWMEWETSSIQLSANTTYWLVFCLDTPNGVRYQSGAGRHVWWFWPYGDWPEALDDTPASRNNNQYVMQATYTTE